jgi:hypothetical protein
MRRTRLRAGQRSDDISNMRPNVLRHMRACLFLISSLNGSAIRLSTHQVAACAEPTRTRARLRRTGHLLLDGVKEASNSTAGDTAAPYASA